MTRRSSLLLAIGAALLAGLAVAAFSLATQGDGTGGASATPLARPPVGPALRNQPGTEIRAVGPSTLEARTPDPLGGPDWVVRVTTTRTTLPEANGATHTDPAQRCAQLGRVYQGRFGWIDGGGTFRPVAVGSLAAPTLCGPPRPQLGAQPQLQAFTRIANPASATARPLQSLVWGLTGSDTSATVRIDGRSTTVAPTADGAFVLPAAAAPTRPDVRLTVSYHGGNPVTVDSSYRADAERYGAGLAHLPAGKGRHRAATLSPDASAVVDARYPDPQGGPAYGFLAIRCGRGWCPSEVGRVVGQRVGSTQDLLGIFTDAGPSPNFGPASSNPQPTPRRPLTFDTVEVAGDATGGLLAPASGDPAAGDQRTQPGTTFIEGVADPSVRSVTIASPRDVRTVVPSPRVHAFAAIYDGRFATGRITMTARLANGRTYRTAPFSPEYP